MTRTLIAITFILGYAAGLPANEGFTLEDCIAIARRKQPALQIEAEKTQIASEQVAIAESFFRPQISAEARLTAIDEVRSFDVDGVFTEAITETFTDAAAFFEIAKATNSATALAALDDPTGPLFSAAKQNALNSIPGTIRVNALGKTFVQTQIQMVQPLWAAGRIRIGVDKANQGLRIQRLAQARALQQIEFNVTRAYLTVLLSRHLNKVVRETSLQVKYLEDVLNELIDDDLSPYEFEIGRLQAFRGLLDQQVIEFRQAEKRATAGLLLAIGLPQSTEFQVVNEALGYEVESYDSMQVVDNAVANRPEVAQASAAIRLASLGRKEAKAAFFPEVAAFGQLSTIADDRDFANPNDSAEWAGGVAATVDVFNGGRRLAVKRIADRRYAQAVATLRLTQQFVEQEAREAFLLVEQNQANSQVAEAAYKSAENALERLMDREAIYSDEIGIDFRALERLDDPDLKKHLKSIFLKDQFEDYLDSLYIQDRLVTHALVVTTGVKYYSTLFGYNLAHAKLRLAMGINDDTIPGRRTGSVSTPSVDEQR